MVFDFCDYNIKEYFPKKEKATINSGQLGRFFFDSNHVFMAKLRHSYYMLCFALILFCQSPDFVLPALTLIFD